MLLRKAPCRNFLLVALLEVEIRCFSSAGNSEEGLKTSCSMRCCRRFSVTEKNKMLLINYDPFELNLFFVSLEILDWHLLHLNYLSVGWLSCV